MKKLIQSFYFLILFTSYLLPQWSNDPNNNLIIGYGWDPHIVSDSAGGCYVTYNYESFYPQKLAVERLDLYGFKPWGNKKQILGELPEQWQAEIVEDGEGGVIISYEDNEDNGTVFTTRVRVQRVDSNGIFLWGQTGIRASVVDTNQGSQRLISDGNGGCVIVWMISSSDYSAEYWINRMDGDGQRVWSDTGIYIQKDINWSPASIVRASDGNYYVQIRRNLYRIRQNGEMVRQDSTTLVVIMPDPEGGIVQTGITGNINNRILVSQRKDSLRNNLWQEPFVEIADSLFINSRLSIRYNNNYYFGWTSNKNGIETQPYIQGLRNDGTELFVDGGIPLSNSSTTITSFIPIIPSDNSSNIYVWTQWINQPSSTGNFAKRIDTIGVKLWGDSAVLLNSPALYYLGVTTDYSGGAIGTGYLNEDFAIRVFKISANGKLGEIITGIERKGEEIYTINSFLFQNFPNPFNPTTTISYSIPKNGLVVIKVFDVLGIEVAELVNEVKETGNYSVTFNASELPSGIYFYQLKTGGYIETKKMILIK